MIRRFQVILALAVLLIPAISYLHAPKQGDSLSLPVTVQKIEQLLSPKQPATAATNDAETPTPSQSPATTPATETTAASTPAATQPPATGATVAPAVLSSSSATSVAQSNVFVPTVMPYVSSYVYPTPGLPSELFYTYLRAASIIAVSGFLMMLGVVEGFVAIIQGAGPGFRATRRAFSRGQQ